MAFLGLAFGLAVVMSVVLPEATRPTTADRHAAAGPGVIATFADFMQDGPSTWRLILLAGLLASPVTLVHEVGHALMARWRLGTNVVIRVGNSGRLGTLRVGRRITAEVHAFALPGRVSGLAGYDATRATRADVVRIALAGPAASLAGTILPLLAYGRVTGLLHDVCWVLIGEGILATLVNLIPMRVVEGPTQLGWRTDGAMALDALRAQPRRAPAPPATPLPHRTPGAQPLRGRGGVALGVEPLPRSTAQPDPADDGLARRARRLKANEWRSVPPPDR
jgi:hypothetical protein